MGVAADWQGCGSGGEEFDEEFDGRDSPGGGGVAASCGASKLFSSLRPHTLFEPDREIKAKKGKEDYIDKSNTNYIHFFFASVLHFLSAVAMPKYKTYVECIRYLVRS